MISDKTWSGHQSRNLVIEHVIILIILSGMFCFLFSSTFHAQFDVIDDHTILRISAMETSFWSTAWVLLSSWDFSIGRFRPVHTLFYATEIFFLGTNPGHWHIVTTGLGMLTCFLFYLAMRRIGVDILSSFTFVLLLSVTGSQNVIWYRLGPGETLGMLFTAISVWAIASAVHQGRSRFWDSLALMTMALAGLTKESFELIIPALLLLRWTLQCWLNQQTWRQAWRGLRAPLMVGLAIFIVEISAIAAVWLLKPQGYGASVTGLSFKSFDPRGWYISITSSELSLLARYVPFLSALVLAVHWPEKSRLYIFAGSLIFAAWVVPQLILYSQGMGDRYLFPAIVGFAAAIACSLTILWQKRIWVLWVACVIWLLPTLSNGLRTTTQVTSAFTARTRALNKMVNYLAENVKAEEAIVIVADPASDYEPIYSLRDHLQFAGSTSPVYLSPVFPKQGYTDKRYQDLARSIIADYPGLSTLDSNHIGGVIVLTPPVDSPDLPTWLTSPQWREKIFNELYCSFSLQKLWYVKAGDISYRILMPASEPPLAVPPDYPLIIIDPSLRERVGIGWLLKTAWWGIEDWDGFSRLWLGHGEAEGLAGTLWSAEKCTVSLVFEVQPGPGREDNLRTVEVALGNGVRMQTAQQQFDQATTLTFAMELQPGRNDFSFKVLEEATILRQPNGDNRPLLVLLRHITVKPLPNP